MSTEESATGALPRRRSRRSWLILLFGAALVLSGVGSANAQTPTTDTAPTTTVTTTDGATSDGEVDPAGVISVDINNLDGDGNPDSTALSQPLAIILLLTVISVAPAMLILLTSFTRIIIVLGLTRNALSLQGVPPNQVLIGLGLFLSLFVMAPVLSEANEKALQPFLDNQIEQGEAFERGLEPFRDFMLENVRERDLALFVRLADGERPAKPEDVATTTLIPAFVIGELRAAFLIGFVIFIPFLVIDMVVSATLMSMGMVMLPPVIISLPFKLLLFVVVDGWYLLVQSLVRSFG